MTEPSAATIVSEKPFDASTSMNSENTVIEENLKLSENRPTTPPEVTWDGDDDPENPRNWPLSKKWYHRYSSHAHPRHATLSVSLAILCANFGTSIVTPGVVIIAEDFGVSFEVGILGISLYLIGFGTYPPE